MNLRILAAALTITVITSCSGRGSDSISEISRRRTCRANMNTLCTDQARYYDAEGDWAGTIEELDEFAGRVQPLTCPESREDYILELSDSGYVIRCPAGHGSIVTGTRSWTGGN